MTKRNSSAIVDTSGQGVSRKYPSSDVKYLYGAAAGRCAFANCRKFVLLPGSSGEKVKQIGKIAHIVAHSVAGPRGDPNYPADKLDTYENWVLLCPSCHDIVDAQPEKYSIEFLRTLKKDHEMWVDKALSTAMTKVTFSELAVAIKGIQAQGTSSDNSLTIVVPEEKIQINHLSTQVRNRLVLGLMQAPLVQSFFIAMEKADATFERRVVNGFQKEYLRLRDAGETPDEIFDDLHRFSSMNSPEFEVQAAGLALLAHLFEKCDVFERTEEEKRHVIAN